MKGLANVYPSRLRRVMQWSVAGALAASLALLGGGYLASADTAVVPTPTVATVAPTTVATVAPTTVATVAPTTVATVAPTTVATVAPTTVATQSKSSSAPIRKRDTQPSACVGSGDACPVTMGLRFTNLTDSATSTFRVGDRVEVGVVIKSAVATQSFGLAAYLDFATADYQLLKGSEPAASGDTGVFAVEQSIGGANVQVIGGVNKYAEASMASGGTIGKLDLDLIASPPESGPMSGASLAAEQEYSVATATFRVKRNDWSGTGKFAITVRPSDAGDNRNSVVTGGSSVEGVNIMSGPMTSAGRNGKPTVVRTHAELIAVAPTPNPNAPRRVGDVVPIDIVLRAPAGEYVRHVNAVQARINVASPSFRVTNDAGTPIEEGAPAIYRSTDTSRLDIGATATGTFAVDPYGGNPQVVLNVTGTNVPRLIPGQTAVVGRMYVQAMRKADPNVGSANTVSSVTVTMAGTDAIGERLPNGTVAFAPMVVASPPSISETSTPCTNDLNRCAGLPLGAVRGTTGVSLTVRSPLAATPSVHEAAPAFAYATDTFRPFLGVQGRYVDVAVIVDAGVNAAGSRAVDRFDIDLTYDQNVFASGTPQFEPATGITLRGGAQPTTSPERINLRLDRTAGAVTVPTEVGRVRLQLKNTVGTSSPDFGSIRVTPGTSATCDASTGTRLWSSTSPFCDIYADYADGSNRIGEFDRNANVVNQPAASLQIGARLQGRRGTTDATRFIQPVDVILRASGQTSAAPRLLTPNDHAWNFVPGPDSYTFRAATTTSNQTGGMPGCDNGWRPTDAVSNVVLATATFNPGAIPTYVAQCAINSIEPGTYDVYIKGQSSVGVLVKGVPFLPGQFRTLTGLTLREGDIVLGETDTDRVTIADFTAFSAAYNGYPADITQAASTNWNPMADLNQSGFIDILDFSLLATNYGTSSASQVDTIDLPNGLSLSASPANMPASASRTFGVQLNVGSNTLRHAVVSIDAKGTTQFGPPARVCLAGQATCPSALTGPVRLQFDEDASGQVDIGQIMVSGVATGTATLIIRLEEAEGTAGTPASRAFFKADDLVRSFDVVPDVTWNLVVAPVAEQPNQFTAKIVLDILGPDLSEGSFEISWTPQNGLAVDSLTCSNPTCSVATNAPTVTLSVPAGGLTGNNQSLGPVTFTYDGPDQVTGTLTATPFGLKHVSGTSEILLVSGLSANGSATRTFVGSVTSGPPTVSASRVRVAAVRTRSTSPNADLWVRADTTDTAVGTIIPVTVGVTTGQRAIDGAQIALKAAPGTQFVDRNGQPVTTGAFTTSNVLPNLLRQVVDAGRGLLQVALGRTVASSVSGVSGDGALGTVYLKVTGPVSGDLITLERTGDGQFTTMVAGDGDDLTGTLIGLSADEAVNVPVASSPVTSAPVVGGTSGVAVNLPAAAPAPSRAATNVATNAAIGTATTARPMAMARGLIEDRARGTISVTVPGRFAPIELRTGLLPIAPDQYCPVMRHQTYVRLQDVGIAGATFGVEPGGVLSWVTPDQAGCVNWNAIATGDFTFTKETIMQFQLARAVPGALLWVLDGNRNGELYEVDANGVANYVTAEAFAANQEHFTTVWANVIPVSTAQVDGLAARGSVKR